jgi:hypothetical protein
MKVKNRPEFPSNNEEHEYGQEKLEQMMTNAGLPDHLICGPSPFSADEWTEADPACGGPESWPEWKIEDDLAYARFIDDFYERGDG